MKKSDSTEIEMILWTSLLPDVLSVAVLFGVATVVGRLVAVAVQCFATRDS
jgi:hypothetical protein